MNNTNALVASPNIQGDITNCRIETTKISVNRNSAFSFTEQNNFQSYDVCTKDVITTYSTNNITGFGGFLIGISILFLFVVVFAFGASHY